MGDSNGLAFLHDGTIYYSPNSTRHVIVPARTDPNVYQFTQKNARLDRFQQPQWWTAPYGFLAFVPLIPAFDGAAFGCLRDISAYICSSYEDLGKFILSPEKVVQWMDLENLLFLVSSFLKNDKRFFFGPSLAPIAPSYIRYHLPFDTPRAARLRATAARDWFVVLMGHLSFLLGHFEDDNHNSHIGIPRWFPSLESKGIPQSWLCSLQASTVCNFSSRCPRVGLFLDFLDIQKDQPEVKWYTRLNIPVWYPWTARHEKAVKETPQLGYLQPPLDLLQTAATFIIRNPTAILPSALLTFSSAQPFPPSSAHPLPSHPQSPCAPRRFFDEQQPYQGMDDGSAASGANLQATRMAHIATKPWLKFFQARDELNKTKLATETPAQRQTRVNRERKPPIKKVDVFSWDWSDEDPLQLVRTRVTRREGEDILSSFSDSQLVYDSYSNVWDACDYFGQPDDDTDDESSALPHAPITSVVANNDGNSEQLEHEAFYRDQISKLHALPPSERFKKLFLSYSSDTLPKPDLTQDAFDILGYLTFHYGFVPPLPLQSNSPVDLKDWEENIKNIGLDVRKNASSVDLAAPIVNFLKGFRSAAGPSQELWDLRLGNRRPVGRPVSIISKHNNNLFFLSPHSLHEPHCPWTIALTTAADALFVYRLLMGKKFSAISLGYVLVDEGIRFLTLQPLLPVSIPSSIRTVRTVIPIRVRDYTFNVSDYHAYVQERARLLSSPRGRAALLEGGIISRIAKEHLGHDCAALGPSPAVTVRYQGFSFRDSAGTTYWDDKLTDDEILIICGLYRCYTGRCFSLYSYPSVIDFVAGSGSQVADVSWWPTPLHWDNHNANGFNWGHWTEWNEVWYQQRVKDILSGEKNGVPFTQSTWRSKLKGSKSWKQVTKRVQDESNAFF
jgi:hypothetical protein